MNKILETTKFVVDNSDFVNYKGLVEFANSLNTTKQKIDRLCKIEFYF